MTSPLSRSSWRSMLPTVTSWDVRAALRAALFAAVLLVLAFVVTALTDEGHVAFIVRVGRALPAAPVCGAVGAWLALRSSRVRGEVLALESLGRSPFQNGIAAAVGGVAVVVMASTLAATLASVDVSGFYPRATRAEDYRFDGRSFVNARRGFRVAPDGDVELIAEAPSVPQAASDPSGTLAAVPAGGRFAAALALALAGAGLALLASRSSGLASRAPRRGPLADGAAVVVTVALSIVLFHAAAVGRVAPLAASMPSALLLAWSVFRYRAPPWTTRRRS